MTSLGFISTSRWSIGMFCLGALTAHALWGAVQSDVIVIDSLAALAEQAGQSHVRVKMKPGLYALGDPAMWREAQAKSREPQGKAAGPYRTHSLLHFAGDDSVYDLTGVMIDLDTKLHQSRPGPLDKLFVSGDRTTIRGLAIRDVGDTPPGRGGLRMVQVIGDGNRLENISLYVRGSSPYGYGNLLGKGGNALVPLHKQSSLLITGRDNQIVGARVITRAFGHGIVMQGAVNTLIKDCYVEGEMRATDEMLKETSGLAHDVGFQSDYPPGPIVAGLMIALSEDGIRSYPNGSQVGGRRTENVTVLNCKVQNMRSGYALAEAGGKVIISGCSSIGCNEKGYAIPSGGVIENCSGDAMYGPLLALHDRNSRGCRVDLVLLEKTSDYPPARLAEINGSAHTIIIKTDGSRGPPASSPIVLGESFWADVHFFRNPSTTRQSWTGARGIQLENQTAAPLVLSETARDCVVTTRGDVLRDEGENNRVRKIAAADQAQPRALR